jgi:hypothetical protein
VHNICAANLPTSCDEARLLYGAPTGATPIDVDGTGPLPMVLVWCEMYADYGVGVIDHNLANRTSLRSSDDSRDGLQLDIAYR